MKIIQSSVFRALCSVAVGILLIMYPNDTPEWITVAIGIIFLLSGIISCLSYLYAINHVSEYQITDAEGNIVAGNKPMFPIAGIGSLILGIILIVLSVTLIRVVVMIIGVILVLGAVGQIFALISARKWGLVSWGFWIAPCLILLAGLYVVFHTTDAIELQMLILGWCLLLYGCSETLNTIKIYLKRRSVKKAAAKAEAESAVLIEEIKDDGNTTPLE